ncbi:monocarboxylate transporter 12-B-like [Haliotis rufescens]|uniref:monocarboxylate transporter 12-B-like n=1 Tax=Haliotis rufescens TaxID=6454 RepID=UPI00201F3A7E|nr:monocarboxylate transporter 12-B-like [Haliotis rufescens]
MAISREKDGVKEPMGEQEDTEDLPIDRGWAWFVLAGSFLNIVLMVGYIKSLSILFVEYLRLFEASVTTTTLIMGVTAGVFSISALFSMHFVLEKLGIRKTVMLGAAITSVAMLAAVFAPNLTFLICVHCVLTGIGNSMINGPGIVVIGRYFKKRRGLATAISMSGISIASGVFPMVVRLLLDEYGIRGTMLICTGLTMNMFVGATLFRPIESFKKKKRPILDVEENGNPDSINKHPSTDRQNGNAKSDLKVKQKDKLTGNVDKRHKVFEDGLETPLSCSADSHKDTPLSPLARPRTVSNASRTISESEKRMFTSDPELLSISILDLAHAGKDEFRAKTSSFGEEKSKCCKSNILDLSLIKMPMFQLFAITSVFGICINLTVNYIPAFANENHINKTDSALLLLIMGSTDFFCRIILGVLVDLKLLKVNQIMAIGLILSGTMAQFTFFFTTYPLMIMFSIFHGIFGSSYQSLVPILIVDYMGLEYMGKTLGFSSMLHGMSIAMTHPILGSIKEASGTYSYCYTYLGCSAYVAAGLLLVGEPLVRRKVKAKEIGNEGDKESNAPLKDTT